MAQRKRRTHSALFKSKVALAAMAGDKILATIIQQFKVHSYQIPTWKKQLCEGAADVFNKDELPEPPVDVKELPTKIWQLTLEKEFLEDALNKVGAKCKAMINRGNPLSTSRQAHLQHYVLTSDEHTI